MYIVYKYFKQDRDFFETRLYKIKHQQNQY